MPNHWTDPPPRKYDVTNADVALLSMPPAGHAPARVYWVCPECGAAYSIKLLCDHLKHVHNFVWVDKVGWQRKLTSV